MTVPGLPNLQTDQGSITVHARATHRLHPCRAGSNPERGSKDKGYFKLSCRGILATFLRDFSKKG